MEKYENIANEILDIMPEENIIELLYNVVKYAMENNHCRCNYIAEDLLQNVIPDDDISRIFDEK